MRGARGGRPGADSLGRTQAPQRPFFAQFLDGEEAVDLQAGGDQLRLTITRRNRERSAGVDRIHQRALIDPPRG